MPDQYQESLQLIAHLQLLLCHRVAVWYTFAQADPLDQRTTNAGELAEAQARELLKAVQEAAGLHT